MHASRVSLTVASLSLTALAALAMAALPAAAHEHYPADPYDLVVGWTSEPAVVDEMNGLDFNVNTRDIANNSSAPVEGAQLDLSALLIFGSHSRPMALAPQEDRPGWYTFDFIPTQAGPYSVRITGTLNGTAINVTATLEDAVAREDLGFPLPAPSAPALEASIAAAAGSVATLGARVGALEANSSSGALAAQVAQLRADNESLKSTATLAELLAVVGILAGAAGAGLAMRGRRTPPKSG
jgi:hypothetical protein